MPQKRRKKGEVRGQILENLKRKGPLSFTRLKNRIAEASGKPVADKVVWHNLEALREEGKLEKNEKGEWRITESYWRPLAKRDLIEALAGEEQKIEIGRPMFTPTFSLGGGGRHIETKDAELEDIAVNTLTEQISGILWGYSKSERVIILDFASRSLWNGYQSHISEDELQECHIDFKGEKYGRDLKVKDLIDLWEVEVLFSMAIDPYKGFGLYLKRGVSEALGEDFLNLPEHVELMFPTSLAKLLYEGIDPPWFSHVQDLNHLEQRVCFIRSAEDREEILEKIAELRRTISQKLRVKEFSKIEGEAEFSLKKVPTDRKKNLKWLREHRDHFLEFVRDVRDIQFAQVVAVGYEELEHHPRARAVIREVEDLLESFKHAWDPHAAVELEVFLERGLPNTMYRLEKGKKPRKGYGLPRSYASLRDVYENYPGAKKLEWWKKIKTKVKETLEKTRRSKPNLLVSP